MQYKVTFFFFMVFVNLVNGQNLSNIQVLGIIRDGESKLALQAEILVIYQDNLSKQNSITTNSEGQFELNTINKELKLIIKADGYISSIVRIANQVKNVNRIVLEIPLVKLQTQQGNQVYLQSTTTKGVTVNNKSQQTSRHSTHQFQAIDGVTGEIIPASFKLFSTESSNQINFITNNQKPYFRNEFPQKDIIAVEVIAESYQKYLGNLIIESLDNQLHQNFIRLVKTFSCLNLIIKDSAKISNIKITDVSVPENPIEYSHSVYDKIHFSLLTINRPFKIKISYKDGTFVDKYFKAKEGVTQIELEEKLSEPDLNNDTQILYFEQSSVSLKEVSKQKMNDILLKLKQNPKLKIELIGHSDNVGNNHQNQLLSEIRAKYVSIFLSNNGIDDNRISLKGVGHTRPKAENNSEENRSLNRRVEIKLY